MDGYQVMKMDNALKKQISLLLQQVTKASSLTVISKMKYNAIVCNIGHFDNEIDMAWLNKNLALLKMLSNHKLINIQC
jgi:adenosylhomocysteinase